MLNARWCVFISGQGSNMAEILDARSYTDVALVVSSKKNAKGLARACRAGVETMVLAKNIDWDQLYNELHARKITHIFLAGFMRIVSAEFLQKWRGVIVNIHPSLLPAYPGVESIHRAYVDSHPLGITTHHVSPVVDAGARIFQQQVLDSQSCTGKTEEQCEFLVHTHEHFLVSKTIGVWS